MAYTQTGPKSSGRRGQYVGHHWYDDIEVLPDEQRVMPVTVPHEVIASHKATCACAPCSAYPSQLKVRLYRQQLRSSGPRRR